MSWTKFVKAKLGNTPKMGQCEMPHFGVISSCVIPALLAEWGSVG